MKKGTTIQELVNNILKLDIEHYKIGVYGKIQKLSYTLQDKDRVEFYEDIVADPKIKREKRAKKSMSNIKKNENIEKLKEAGLKVTHSRCKILELFQNSPDEHYTADKLKDLLTDNGETIGLATIYRVLTQLEMADLIQKNNFQENHSAYELKKSHHDHLICTKCGNIIEFVNEDLEKLQEHISKNIIFH